MTLSLRHAISHLLHQLDPDNHALLPPGTVYIAAHPSSPLTPTHPPPPPPLQHNPVPPPPQEGPIGATTVNFVNGKGSKPNAVVGGHQYCRDRTRDQKSYWKCTLFNLGCKARLVLRDESTVTNQPTTLIEYCWGIAKRVQELGFLHTSDNVEVYRMPQARTDSGRSENNRLPEPTPSTKAATEMDRVRQEAERRYRSIWQVLWCHAVPQNCCWLVLNILFWLNADFAFIYVIVYSAWVQYFMLL